MKNEYTRGYSRGYACASANRWPEHRPPHPPHDMACALFEAMEELADAVDSEIGKFDPDDDLVKVLGPKVEKARRVAIEVSKWLRNGPACGSPEEV